MVLPRTLRRIEYYAFKGCGRLQDIELPDGLEYVGKQAFCESGLRGLAVPPALNLADFFAFASCRDLKRVEFREGREVLGRTDKEADYWNMLLRDCEAEEVVLPGTLREISPRVFADCDALRTVLVARGCRARVRKLVGKGVKVQKM